MVFTPCWPVDVCDDCCTEALADLTPEQVEALSELAAYLLWKATGSRLGECEVTYRPCRIECGSTSTGLPEPQRVNGDWLNVSCGSCRGRCSCDWVSEVTIPNVSSVVRIRVDGEDLDPVGTVAVYDRRRIVRIDGQQWPACQNLSTIDGPGSWSITVLQGLPLPSGASYLAGILLCELAKACTGDDSCRLPRRVQTVTRQGVTIGFQDMFDGLDAMRFGIWELDAFIEASRTSVFRQPSITSPDRPRPSRLTWPVLDPEAGG